MSGRNSCGQGLGSRRAEPRARGGDDALRARERDGAIDLPNEKRGRKNPRIGDRLRVVSGPFVGFSGLCAEVSRQQVGVLLLMFKAQRQVRLRRDAVELV